MKIRIAAALFAVFTVQSCVSQAQSSHFNEAEIEQLGLEIDKVAEQFIVERNVPGAALVVVQNGKTIIKRGYGLADVDDNQEVDPDKTIFRIGSISKTLSFLALTKLVDEGRVAIDDDVSKYVDGIDNSLGFEDPITIADLMTHTSGLDQVGLARHIWQTELSLDERKALRPSISDFLANYARRASPAGQYYRYDTYGSTMAGAVLESVTGKNYKEAMDELMFDPLGMSRCSVEVEDDLMADFAPGHGYNDAGNYEEMPYEVYVTTPASSIDATVSDMGRLLEALTSDGSNAAGRFLTAEMTEKVRSPQFRPHPEFSGVTHGLNEAYLGSRRPGGIRQLYHGGSMLGFNSLMVILPEYKLGVYIVANRNREAGGGDARLSLPVMDVVEAALDHPIPDLIPLPIVKPDQDLSEYEGNFYYGVFCHTCSDEEFSNYAWRRGDPNVVSAKDGKLTIRDHEYIPRGDDVFVQADGERMVFFGRDDEGKISFYTYSTSPDTFERID